jgi:hypothetical protein
MCRVNNNNTTDNKNNNNDYNYDNNNNNNNTRQKIAGSIPREFRGIFNLPNPSSRSVSLGSAQPLTEMSTRNSPAGKGRPARKADNLTAICDTIV